MSDDALKQLGIVLFVGFVIFIFFLTAKDYHNGRDAFIIATVIDKLHEKETTTVPSLDEDGMITGFDEVENDYYWLTYKREDGIQKKRDVGSMQALNSYKVGQQIVIKVRIGESGTEYFKGMEVFRGAEANE